MVLTGTLQPLIQMESLLATRAFQHLLPKGNHRGNYEWIRDTNHRLERRRRRCRADLCNAVTRQCDGSTGVVTGTILVDAKLSNITYATTYSSAGATSMVYKLRLRAEAL
jgi:hypothetical protein